ncbi:Zinc-finger homeodomain protein 2 [Striga hermonthica]|uniref:Zinc-finger homeodomain protein 2 n=1 Tax=Striga hermonthica TaxID=68872 RepID=A0A9N7NKM7_STRHE|nr:Zinc-finger homeodomain protein 2 [Striga hermonthica]
MEGDNTDTTYKECLRNHAASLGSYATDGCGEFSPDHSSSLCCAACGCHRSFHRKVIEDGTRQQKQQQQQPAAGKKRSRTKFTVEQKEKMMGFAEKIGWRLQRKLEEDDEIERFCRGVGITRKIFKVWMHNHKNQLVCRTSAACGGNASSDLTDH